MNHFSTKLLTILTSFRVQLFSFLYGCEILLCLIYFLYLSLQEGVLSPVQDGDNKPQIDSNKANNYKIVKEVNS